MTKGDNAKLPGTREGRSQIAEVQEHGKILSAKNHTTYNRQTQHPFTNNKCYKQQFEKILCNYITLPFHCLYL